MYSGGNDSIRKSTRFVSCSSKLCPSAVSMLRVIPLLLELYANQKRLFSGWGISCKKGQMFLGHPLQASLS